MKKIRYIGFVVLLSIMVFTILSYGYKNNHPTLNGLIVDKFLSVAQKKGLSDFQEYRFELKKPKLKGSFIAKSGLFNPSNPGVRMLGDQSVKGINATYTESEKKMTPEEWIKHGGFAADVPEVPASLRHFYDPSKKINERYLTDKVNSKVMKFAQSFLPNPKTNGVDWALGTGGNYGVLEHIYTWEHGKQYMRGALEVSDIEKRNNYMAKAWRSLGETLHMIADNGCPVHVRNDGHPPIPVPGFEQFGNPDPYEEQMEVTDISKFDVGAIPIELQDKFRKLKTTREIAHNLAVFTNENFFSNETISGIDWKGNSVKPVTNPDFIHKSPKINSSIYNNNYYRKEINGKEVLLCTDTWFFKKYPIYKTIPYINEECVESQAKVLIPTIKEAGVNVMKLFIPKLEITITELDEDGKISGIVSHEKDEEYTREIKYNGPVKIMNIYRSKIAELTASGGHFSGQIDTDEQTTAVAEIEFGGIIVDSKEFTIKAKKEKKVMEAIDRVVVEIWFEAEIEDLDDGEREIVKKTQYLGMGATFKPTVIKNKTVSSESAENNDEFGRIQRTILLKFNDNNKYKSLHGFSFKRTMKGGAEDENSSISAAGSNIPFKVEYGRNNYLSFTYKGDISKYLSQVNFSNNGYNSDNSQWSRKLINYRSPGEIKIDLHFKNTIYDYEKLE